MDPEKAAPKVKHHVPWITLLLLAGAIAVFFFSIPGQLRLVTGGMHISSSEAIIPKSIRFDAAAPSAPSITPAAQKMEASFAASDMMAIPSHTSAGGMAIAPEYYPRPYGGSSNITDTREFLKTTYSAVMKTRKVQEMTRRAETTIRGYDGRIDSTSSSQKNGYVNFVVPASKFEDFRIEIEKFVGERFLTVNVSSYNKLGEKQGIEATQKNVELSLEELKTERAKVVAVHNSTVSSLSSQIDAAETEINALRSLPPTNDTYEWNRRVSRENQLSSTLTTVYARLNEENQNYKALTAQYDSQIKYASQNLEGVKKQDQNLLDDVATVSGSITFNWISLWDIVQLYVPGKVIAGALALLAVLVYFWERRRNRLA